MNCLCCGKELGEAEELKQGWHGHCIRRFFGTTVMPELDITEAELEALAVSCVDQGLTVPGVQKKLSLHLSQEADARLTLVDYPTGYILKPPSEEFEHLPEAEDLVMRLAERTGIPTVPHALMWMEAQNGMPAYITKRIDRVFSHGNRNMKLLAMEDFCQLAERLTEDKYHGSYELCARLIRRYSSQPGLDLAELYLRLLFCYVTGNSDMHLKNFSLIETAPGNRSFKLSAAYDLLPVNLVMPEDTEEMALTLNGKKRKLRRSDFLKYAETCGIQGNAAEKMLARIVSLEDIYQEACRNSYLPGDMKEGMCAMIGERMENLRTDR